MVTFKELIDLIKDHEIGQINKLGKITIIYNGIRIVTSLQDIKAKKYKYNKMYVHYFRHYIYTKEEDIIINDKKCRVVEHYIGLIIHL